MADTGELKSFEDGIARGYRFCGWGSLKEPIEKTYPQLAGSYVGMRCFRARHPHARPNCH